MTIAYEDAWKILDRIDWIEKRLGEIARDDYRDSDYQDRLDEEREDLEKELRELGALCT
jgi:hypothetical protein